jgi:hypothetical protein
MARYKKPRKVSASLFKASGDSTVSLEFLEEILHSMTAPVERCGIWYRGSTVSAARNAGFNSLGRGCLSGGGYHRLCRQQG